MSWCIRRCIGLLGDFATRRTVAPETKKVSMFSGLIGRNSTTLPPLMAAEDKGRKGTMKEESFKSKSLYLRFEETMDCPSTEHCPHGHKCAHVIQSIGLSHLLAVPTDDELKPRQVAYRCGCSTTCVPEGKNTSVIGSKIIFSGGFPSYFPDKCSSKEVCLFETDDPNPILQPSQNFKPNVPDPVLLAVAGNIYCFGADGYFNSFEVFDKTHEKWSPLDLPPRRYWSGSQRPGCTYAIAGTKMLVWWRERTDGVFGFDMTHPEKGWTELSSSLGSCIPYDYHEVAQLFVKFKSHRGDGVGDDGFLIFSGDIR